MAPPKQNPYGLIVKNHDETQEQSKLSGPAKHWGIISVSKDFQLQDSSERSQNGIRAIFDGFLTFWKVSLAQRPVRD